MDDRQLLEDAARAAGLTIHARNQAERDALIDPATASLWIVDGGTAWNPLTDDGDALRLAVKLRLAVNHYGEGTAVLLPHHSPEVFSTSPAMVEDNPGDPYAATRRAIVRAAAAIGRQMREAT